MSQQFDPVQSPPPGQPSVAYWQPVYAPVPKSPASRSKVAAGVLSIITGFFMGITLVTSMAIYSSGSENAVQILMAFTVGTALFVLGVVQLPFSRRVGRGIPLTLALLAFASALVCILGVALSGLVLFWGLNALWSLSIIAPAVAAARWRGPKQAPHWQ